ncbi:hypothetical protein CS0771_55560 [Catellatospora sp. IY07-71]|uniref:DUF6365 family protein n=1 Tax=Catellatospora sp. IY07-71 TaxID=2728827 RepID=UPI001BB2FF83|nr:DUF6365 family protein [Catellatospora sp. IY07-71]BCJ76012.1 hypothetical protein CS0771_55560 [Catellatospora sp. IY07-71]
MRRLLFLAPSTLSKGDASLAADMARALPRKQFQVGFVAAADSVAQLHDLGMPTLALTAGSPAQNLAMLDRVVAGFAPDLLIAADAFAVHQSRGWTGLGLDVLRERYGRPVGSLDRLGWPETGYAVDVYGGPRTQFPPLLDDCDVLIRTGPPHRPEPGPPGVVVAPLHLGGLQYGGLRPVSDEDAPRADRPVVFLVNSRWEYTGTTPAAQQLVDALPRLLHSLLAAVGRPLRIIHVGPRSWRFPTADHLDYQHFSRLPYPMFHARLTSADVFLTANALSSTLARAVLAGVPSLLLHNDRTLTELPEWTAACAPQLTAAYPFRVAPLGWHELLAPLVSGNPYFGCFAQAPLFDRAAVGQALTGLLDGRPDLLERQQDYRDRLAALPSATDAFAETLAAAVAR